MKPTIYLLGPAILAIFAISYRIFQSAPRHPEAVVKAYLDAVHARSGEDPSALRTPGLNDFLACLRGRSELDAEIDGTQDDPYESVGRPAQIEGDTARVAVEERFEQIHRVLFTLKERGGSWLIDGTSALAVANAAGCAKVP